jgi:hypothetical protein
MRKLMVMVAMVAMMLVSAAPAFAATANAGNLSIMRFNSNQVQLVAVRQVGFGDSTARARGLAGASAASIHQSLMIHQMQFGF